MVLADNDYIIQINLNTISFSCSVST